MGWRIPMGLAYFPANSNRPARDYSVNGNKSIAASTTAVRWPSERIAATAFGVYLAAAIPILLHLGSDYWFTVDEWAFFIGGSATDPALLFRPLNSHWSALPILVYRALYSVFGLHSYLPYQLCVILLHLTLCLLLRVIMRRAGVGPWMATISAATFVLFGPGQENILLGVQVSQVGSMVLGFTHLVLADHDGRIDRRDWLGLFCGLGSIMSSGIGPLLVAIVGVAVVFRRGWRPALFHTLILAAIYVSWWAWSHPVAMGDKAPPPLDTLVRWVAFGESGVFLALGGGYTIVAVGLGAVLATGLALAWTPLSVSTLRQRASLPAAMLLGALALLAVICTQRWVLLWVQGYEAARASRYISECTALTLPALAVAADALARRWLWLRPCVYALLLVGLAANSTRFSTPQAFDEIRTTLLALAYSPLAEQVPADLRPAPNNFSGGAIDMSFLLAARNSGRLPPPPVMTTELESQTKLRLGIQQLPKPMPAALSCAVYGGPIELNPKVGDYYGLKSSILISLGETGVPLSFNSGLPRLPVLRIMLPDLNLHLAPKPPADRFVLCQ